MILKINGKTISSGIVKLQTQSTPDVAVQAYAEKEHSTATSQVTLSAVGLTYAQWYDLFISGKLQAMITGKGYRNERFKYCFRDGIIAYISPIRDPEIPSRYPNYITSIGGVTPTAPDQRIRIIGDKHVTIFPGKTKIMTEGGKTKEVEALLVACTDIKSGIPELIQDINIYTWRLYHAFNYLTARLLVYDPEKAQHRIDEYPLGACLGTLLEYQAQVARWNHYVWRHSTKRRVESSNEKLLISLGYAVTDCEVSHVRITTDIINLSRQGSSAETPSPDDLPEWVPNIQSQMNSASDVLTIYKQGKSTNIGELPGSNLSANTVTSKVTKIVDPKTPDRPNVYRYTINGFGKDDAQRGWTKIRIEINIPNTIDLSKPLIKHEYYEELFVLAVAYGEEYNIELPESPEELDDQIQLQVDTTWEVMYPDGQVVKLEESSKHAIAAIH